MKAVTKTSEAEKILTNEKSGRISASLGISQCSAKHDQRRFKKRRNEEERENYRDEFEVCKGVST